MQDYIESNEQQKMESFSPYIGEVFDQLVAFCRSNDFNDFKNSDILDLLDEKLTSSISESISKVINKSYQAENYKNIERLRTRVGNKGNIILAAGKGCILSFSTNEVNHSPGEYISTSSRNIFHYVISGELEYKSAKSPEDFDPSTFNQKYKFSPYKEGTLGPGDVLIVPADVEAVTFDATTKCNIISFCSPPVSEFEHTLDATTLAPQYMCSSVMENSILEQILVLSAIFLENEDKAFVEPHLQSKNYRIRWAALKAMMNLEPDSIYDYLGAGAQDPHQSIKNACQSLKARMESVSHGV